MRAVVLLTAVCLAVLLGCGDDDETTVTTQASTVEAAGEGPAGELSERGIGPLELGAGTAAVERAFGSPDGERELPGCELAGPNATPVLQWTWNLDDGAVSIDFDAEARTLSSYRTTSASLPTASGVRVGDSYRTLSDSYGAILRPLDLGAGSTEDAGLWYVGEPAGEWLLFTIAGGSVRTIQGGDIQICE